MNKRARTKVEKRFLKVAAELRQEGRPYCHAEMKRRLGYKSINGVWEIFTRLLRDGFINPEATMRVTVTAPALTPKALRYLKAA